MMPFKMIRKTILITGGSGFIGSSLVRKLACKDNYNIRILDLHSMKNAPSGVEFIQGSFEDPLCMSGALKGCDIIYHLASTVLPSSSNEDMIYDVSSNLVGTIKLLDLAVKHKVQKIIFASSGGTVYGVTGKFPISENHPTNPICSYGITKLAIEKYMTLYSRLYSIQICILRIANPYGESQNINSGVGVIAKFCHQAVNDKAINVYGDGNVARDFIYINDLINVMINVLSIKETSLVLNVGSGKATSLNDLIALIKTNGIQLEVSYLKSRSFDVDSVCLNINRINCLLGTDDSNKTSLSQGVERMINYYMDKYKK